MKTELEQKDIEAIVQRMVEVFKPILVDLINSHQPKSDELMDVKGLAQYLKVKRSWIYEKVHKKEIPFQKAGRFLLFKKKDIDLWLKNPYAPSLNISKPYQS
ncbi:MAG: helix-turn-helix domain-containing protein [Candidatus Jettenia sp.]|nr:helix-turn-helix domain-containing protein [Candidatus Jettenia sp.]